MRSLFLIPCAGILFLMAGCETKVVNQPPSTGNPTVIEHHDRPVVVQPQSDKPEVQNNIHVDK